MCAQIAGRRNSCRFLALTATIIPSLCFFASAALLQPRGYALAKHCTLGSAREGETVASIAASKPHFPRSASSDSSERGAAAEALSDRRSEQHAGANFREHTARPSAAGSCAESFSAETGLAAATPRPRLFGRLNDAGSEGDASALRIFPVLLAGGVGRRFGGAEPKQFLPLVGEADAASISLSKLLALGRNCESQLSPPECVAVVARTKFRKRFAQVLVKTTKRLEVSPPPSASEGSEAREKSVSKGLVFANPGVERWESSWSATEEICRLLLREAGCGDEEAETERELSGGREIQDSPSSRRRRAEFYLRSLKAPPPPLPTQRASSEDTGICGKRPLLERAFVLFHDAARPCFSVTATEAAVRAAASGGAAVVCERATDSLKLADDSGVYAHLPRHHCFHAQTPQVSLDPVFETNVGRFLKSACLAT